MLWLLVVILSTSYNSSEPSLLQNDFGYWGVALIDSFPAANKNGIADPGETLAMAITVRNISSTPALGISCTLYVSSPYITILNEPCYGDSVILPNRTGAYVFGAVISNFAPWGTLIEIEFGIADSVGHHAHFIFSILVSRPNQIIGEHNLGSLAFSVYPYGSFYDFRLPRDSIGVLPKGSLWIGNSESFVLDRDYGPNDDWQIDTLNEGYLALGGTQISDEDARAVFNDSGHPNPKGISVSQLSYNWINSPFDNFVIVRYLVSNSSSNIIDNLYVGQFMNYDIVDSNANFGGVDTLRRLAYMWNAADSFYYGVKLLDPQFISNLSLIDNSQYLIPDSFIQDSIKFRFLNNTLNLSSTPIPNDYSAIISTGPFVLNPADTQIAAFTIMGGESLQDLYLVAEDAQRLYDSLFVSVEEDGFTSKPTVGIFTISSNPSRNKINIEYTLVEKSEVNLSIFDATGRFVAALVNTTQGPGSYKHTCNTANLSQGVYFVRLHTREKSIVEKVIFLR
jgi:serine protease